MSADSRPARGGLRRSAERLVADETATLGTDILRRVCATYPGKPCWLRTKKADHRRRDLDREVRSAGKSHVLIYDGYTGAVLAPIPLWRGSEIAGRFNAFEQPNGLAVGSDDDV